MHWRTLTLMAAVTLTASIAASQVIGQEPQTAEAVWQPSPAVVAFQGSYSGIRDRAYERVMVDDVWAEVWTNHMGERIERDSYSVVVSPGVDFERYMVIGIFNGEGWNTRNMHIVEVRDGETLEIRFDAGTYQTASFPPTEIRAEGELTPEEVEKIVLENMEREDAARDAGKHDDPHFTTAYGMFVLPRTNKPVVLIENVQNLLGEPPIWEEKFRFERVKK